MLTGAQELLRSVCGSLQCELETRGDLALLEGPRRALLVSRAERAPAPDTGWILAARRATEHCVDAGETLVVGAGRVGWDCALWTCAARGGAAIIICENHAQLEEYALNHAELLPSRHLLLAPTAATVAQDKIARWLCRDRLVGELADRAALILINEGGNMVLVLNALRARRCACLDYQIPLPKEPKAGGSKSKAVAIDDSEVDSALAGKLVHYVRAPLAGQWPGETRGEYLQWLCSGDGFTPRDEFNTLRRILAMRTLLGTGELIPGGELAVCFTAQTVAGIRAQRRWRRGLSRWTFSSYGLALQKTFLESCGAREVRYVDDPTLETSAATFVQKRSSKAGSWSDELEWRAPGNVDFAAHAAGSIVALCATDQEAAALRNEFGMRAFAIG